MTTYSDPLEKIIFNYGTTYLTDYQEYELTAPIHSKYKPKPPKPRPEYKPLRYVETLTDWKTPVSFTLYHKPKRIVRENPHVGQKKYEKPIDEEKEMIIKTRPRLVMTPAVSMDDIDDPKARDVLVKDIYLSTYMKANNDIRTNYFSVRAPFPGCPAPGIPINLPKSKQNEVPEEWRKELVSWDSRQIRGYCSPTESFWLNYKLPPCKACDETKIAMADRLQKSMKRKQIPIKH